MIGTYFYEDAAGRRLVPVVEGRGVTYCRYKDTGQYVYLINDRADELSRNGYAKVLPAYMIPVGEG